MALLAFLCVLCGQAIASKMAYSLQQAIYLFEMKGDVDEAVRILEKVVSKGDAEDKENAFFRLELEVVLQDGTTLTHVTEPVRIGGASVSI